jgi:hypothetical protein
MFTRTLALCLLSSSALFSQVQPRPEQQSPYLFAWCSGGRDKSDLLATIDARSVSPTYGQVLASTPVGVTGGAAHHTEHEISPEGTLFASLYLIGRTFVFDISKPLAPRVLTSFDNIGPYSHAHSFVRLSNGNVLSTLQEGGHSHGLPGALVEMSSTGELLEVAPARDPKILRIYLSLQLGYRASAEPDCHHLP